MKESGKQLIGLKKMKLSLLIPSIRINKWDQFYNSVIQSCTKYDFEIIFVGPEPNIQCDAWKDFRVKYIRDFRAPNLCQNIALQYATGDIVFAAADDCIFNPGTIDIAMGFMEQGDRKRVVVTKYTEGMRVLQHDNYYLLDLAYPQCNSIKDTWVIFNSAFLYRKYLLWLGGWDCNFQVPAFGHADLAVRAQRDGCQVVFYRDALMHVEHGQADHKPIEDAHVNDDTPIYINFHNKQETRIQVDIDSWKSFKDRWSKRNGQT